MARSIIDDVDHITLKKVSIFEQEDRWVDKDGSLNSYLDFWENEPLQCTVVRC